MGRCHRAKAFIFIGVGFLLLVYLHMYTAMFVHINQPNHLHTSGLAETSSHHFQFRVEPRRIQSTCWRCWAIAKSLIMMPCVCIHATTKSAHAHTMTTLKLKSCPYCKCVMLQVAFCECAPDFQLNEQIILADCGELEGRVCLDGDTNMVSFFDWCKDVLGIGYFRACSHGSQVTFMTKFPWR